MELVKIVLTVISLGAVGYGFYCLYRTKQTLEILGNTIEAMWEAEKELRVLLEDIPALKDLIVPSMMEGSIQYPNANFSSQSKLQNCDSVVRDA